MKKIFTICCLFGLLVGCRQSGETADEQGTWELAVDVATEVPVSQMASQNDTKVAPIVSHTTVRNELWWGGAVGSDVLSKANENGFTEGDLIGIYTIEGQASLAPNTNHSDNMKYEYKSGAWSASSRLQNPMVAPNNYTGYGYFPYKANIANALAVSHDVGKVQDNVGAVVAADFMLGASTVINPSTSPNISLKFRHVLSKIIVSVWAPATYESKTLAGIKSIKFMGLGTKCDISLADGGLSNIGDEGAITPRLVSGTGASGAMTTYEAIIPPQAVVAGELLVEITCNVQGGGEAVIEYTAPVAGIDFVSGQQTTITLIPLPDLAFGSNLELTTGVALTDQLLSIFATDAVGTWTLRSNEAWMTLSATKGGTYGATITGTANKDIYVKVDANGAAGAKAREGVLVLSATTPAGKVLMRNLQVVQNRYEYSFAPVAEWEPTAAEKQNRTTGALVSNQHWTAIATSLGDWLKLSTSDNDWTAGLNTLTYNGMGTMADRGLFTKILTANNTNTARTGTVVFKVPNIADKTITVTQAAPTIVHDLPNFSGTAATYSDATKGVTFLTGLQWKTAVKAADTWLTASHGDKTYIGAGTLVPVTVSAPANNTAAARTGTFYVKYGAMDGNLQSTHTVTQAAPTITFAPTSWAPTGAAVTNQSIAVTTEAGVNWKASIYGSTPWLTITSGDEANKTNTGAVRLNVGLNLSPAQRTGTLRVSYATIDWGTFGLTKDFSVTQAASAWTVGAMPTGNFTAASNAGTKDIALTGGTNGLAWAATNNSGGWLTTTASGTFAAVGTGTVSNSVVQANNTAASRKATVTLTTGDKTGAFTVTREVTQDAPTVTLPNPASQDVSNSAGETTFTITAPLGVTWTVASNAAWAVPSPTSGTGTGAAQTIKVEYEGNKTVASPIRAAKMNIGYGTTLSTPYTITQAAALEISAPANCFIVTPGNTVGFNAKIAGNGSVFTGTVPNSTTEAAALQANLAAKVKDVRILWQTKQGHNTTGALVLEDVTFNTDATVAVKARTGGAGGNAVLAAYDAVTDGNILWSWHIWVSPVAESTFAKHNYGNAFVAANGAGKTIMDRNLGAIYSVTNPETVSMQFTGGMLYQWGRKDPFTGSADGTNATYIIAYDAAGNKCAGPLGGFSYAGSPASITQSIQVPMTHYWGGNNDWCNADERRRWQSRTGTGATLDFDNKGGKTIYDPCPAGYRVPTGSSVASQGTWGDFSVASGNPYWKPGNGTTTAGSLFDQAGGTPSWYPAYGCRILNSGALNYVASRGYYWSASPYNNASGARDLLFYSTYVNPVSGDVRSYGFSVRCVQE